VRVALLGLGLIGGSIARALRGLPDGDRPTLVAWSPSGDGPRAALAAGVIDAIATGPGEAVEGASIVILAGPPTSCVSMVGALGGDLRDALRPDATVTDVASTKATIVAAADAAGLPFVGGHPMAGREISGFMVASSDLFDGRPWVVVPGAAARPADLERVEWLALACGARPLRMAAADHDAAVAAISHLPLVISAALVETVVGIGELPDFPDWTAAEALASTGWVSMTRLARGDPAMGAGILATNGPLVAMRLHDLQAEIDGWIAALERTGGPDETALMERLAAARRRLERSRPVR
jgi:prephenate dehydrogenase